MLLLLLLLLLLLHIMYRQGKVHPCTGTEALYRP